MIEGFGEFPFATDGLLVLLKWSYVLGLGMYVIFSLVVIRQVGIMSKTVNGPLARILGLVAWAHLALAVLVLMTAITVL